MVDAGKGAGRSRKLTNRLNAVDRALELNPHYFEAWDFKAELQAGALQFDRRRRSLRQGRGSMCDELIHVGGRRAWIEAQRNWVAGNHSSRCAVLAENAGYNWGWHQLVVWLAGQGASFADAEGAIEQLLKLQPQDAWAQRQLALVRLRQGDKAGAQRVFSAVFDAARRIGSRLKISSTSSWKSARNLTGAAETLRRMQTHQPGARTLAREVILDVLRTGDKTTALKLFNMLCAQPDPDPWPVQLRQRH